MTNEIKTTLTYKMVEDEAKELSVKLQNIVYVVCVSNVLYITLNGKKTNPKVRQGEILCAYNLGSKVK